MCGISVIVALRGTQFTANEGIKNKLEESLSRIVHRGPDHQGIWISANRRVALGHCRLSINDLTLEGSQPLHSHDDKIHAVVNGEIYDYKRMRAELEQSNYTFSGHSDSELVVALYQIHGTSFLTKLRGEFSFCLYDSEKDYFIAARDRYGIKPLFWTLVAGGDRLLISSEAKGFLPLGWQPEWDVRSIREGGWNHDNRTLFAGVNKVLPGHYFTTPSFGLPEIEQYWDMSYPNKHHFEERTEEEMITGVRERLLDAVRLRLQADVPVGIYLSGGIDSSIVAGMVAHLVREEGLKIGNDDGSLIRCFSIAFDAESGFDESSIAARTAEWLGVTYEKIHMNEGELAKNFEDATYHIEHHNPDFNFVGKFALSTLPRNAGFKVVLTGEGSDEIFAGYHNYLPDFLSEPDHTWAPTSLSKATLSEEDRERMYTEVEARTRASYIHIGGDVSNRAPSQQLNNITTPASMAAFECPTSTFAPWTVSSITALQTIANNVDERVQDLIREAWHPVHAALYVWSKGNLANIMLSCLGDRTEMAHSIEARPPFLDHHLTEYVNGLPPSAKVRWDGTKFTEKWILREAGRPFITQEIYERTKHPYIAPTIFPIGGALYKLFERLVTKDNVENLGFVNWESVSGLLDKAFEKRDTAALRTLINVGQWVVLSKRFGIAKAVAS